VNGPERPLVDVSDAAVQLHHTCHSFNAQQFREDSDGSADKADEVGGSCSTGIECAKVQLSMTARKGATQ